MNFDPQPCTYNASPCFKCFYDIRMVRTSKTYGFKTPYFCDTGKLGDRIFRVLFPGPCKQARASDLYPSAAQDNAGSYNNVCICSFYLFRNEGETYPKLCLGLAVHGGRRLLHIQAQLRNLGPAGRMKERIRKKKQLSIADSCR